MPTYGIDRENETGVIRTISQLGDGVLCYGLDDGVLLDHFVITLDSTYILNLTDAQLLLRADYQSLTVEVIPPGDQVILTATT